MAAKTPEQVKTEKAFNKLSKEIDLLNQCVNECEGSELDRMSEEIVYNICECLDKLIETINGRRFTVGAIREFKAAYAKFSKKIQTLIDFTLNTEGSERENDIGRYAKSVKRAVPTFQEALITGQLM